MMAIQKNIQDTIARRKKTKNGPQLMSEENQENPLQPTDSLTRLLQSTALDARNQMKRPPFGQINH